MCQTHAKLIDSDEITYPADVLQSWKQEAENRAIQRLQERAPLNELKFYQTDLRKQSKSDSASKDFTVSIEFNNDHNRLRCLKHEMLRKIELFPNVYKGSVFLVQIMGIGQENDDNYIVNHDLGLARAAGTSPGDTLRFQAFVKPPNSQDDTGFYVYKIHADGDIARIIVTCIPDMTSGASFAGELQGKIFVLEFRGNYLEMCTGFIVEGQEKEWAPIWAVKGLLDHVPIDFI
jgi:hypothetical protein